MTGSVGIEIVGADAPAMREWRERYRRDMNCQIVHDSWHARGFTSISVLRLDGREVGSGAVAGDPGQPKDTVKEFFVEPAHRGAALGLLGSFIAATGARWIEAQTNDPLLSVLIFDCASELASKTILFADAFISSIPAGDGRFRRLTEAEREGAFPHTTEPVGDWGVEAGEIGRASCRERV